MPGRLEKKSGNQSLLTLTLMHMLIIRRAKEEDWPSSARVHTSAVMVIPISYAAVINSVQQPCEALLERLCLSFDLNAFMLRLTRSAERSWDRLSRRAALADKKLGRPLPSAQPKH